MSAALIGLHVFTGNGKVSAISGFGKVNPYKKVLKSQELQHAFVNLGNEGNKNFPLRIYFYTLTLKIGFKEMSFVFMDTC